MPTLLIPVRYCAPDPTPEQIQNGIDKGYDSSDRIGMSKIWALTRCHDLAAAATIHDEMYLYILTAAQRKIVDSNFARDCAILAAYAEKFLDGGIMDEIEKAAFPALVFAASPFIDTSTDRNTLITRAQGKVFMNQAMEYINQAAHALGWSTPYVLDPDITKEPVFKHAYSDAAYAKNRVLQTALHELSKLHGSDRNWFLNKLIGELDYAKE